MGCMQTFGTFNVPTSWSWRIPSAIQALPSGIQVVLVMLVLPESPRWLCSKGRYVTFRLSSLIAHTVAHSLFADQGGGSPENSGVLPRQRRSVRPNLSLSCATPSAQPLTPAHSTHQHGSPRRVRVRRNPSRDQVRQGGRGERRLAEPHPVPGQQEASADHGRDRVLLAVAGEQHHVSPSHAYPTRLAE